MAAYKYSAKKLSFLDNAKDAFTATMLSLPSQPMLEPPRSPASGTRQTLLDIQHLLNPARTSSKSQSRPLEDPFNSRPAENDKPLPPTPSDSGYDTLSEPSPTTPTFATAPAPSTTDIIDILPRISSSHLRTFARETQIYTTLRSSSYNKHSPSNSTSDTPSTTSTSPLKPDLVPRPLSIQKRASSASTNLLNLYSNPDPNANAIPPVPTRNPLRRSTPLLSLTPVNPLKPTKLPTPSVSPTLYASHTQNLTTLHAQLIKHISTLNTLITDTVNAQTAHRATQSKRMASFWTFTPYTSNTDAEVEPGSHKLSPMKGLSFLGSKTDVDGRGWSGLNNGMSSPARSKQGTQVSGGNGVERRWKKEETQQERAARIKRLRERGWRVSKELYGWRGEGYYEKLRDGAIADLGGRA